ncbi:MAG: hypothetical protein COA44_06030 [Arcobacter sp.]|nr:MAG: hypothetical protein COA44_06030 [Arcobacter sp.]
MRTHGEQWLSNKDRFYKSTKYFNNCTSIDKGLPKRMSKTNTLAYYNQKLQNYWTKIKLFPNKKELPMSHETKLQKEFNEIDDDQIINITKSQLIELIALAKADAIKTYSENNLFNAREVFNSLKPTKGSKCLS